jgi:hypothetical protein
MGRGGVKPKAGEPGQGLEERKKVLEKELHEVEEKLAQLAQAAAAGEDPGAKKGKKDKPAKEKKEKKAKAPKAHPSSKAGPGFSVALTDDLLVMVANINKKGHAYKTCGLREGDVLLRISEHDVSAMNLNEVKSKLVAACGTVLRLELCRPGTAAAGAGSFAEWLASARGGQEEAAFAGPYSADVILEFGPLVKSIKSGKPAQRGASAVLSLHMADSQVKRELFFVAGALQPLCKLLTDPKAAAQVDAGIKSLQNMLRISMWDQLSVALSAMGKHLSKALYIVTLHGAYIVTFCCVYSVYSDLIWCI